MRSSKTKHQQTCSETLWIDRVASRVNQRFSRKEERGEKNWTEGALGDSKGRWAEMLVFLLLCFLTSCTSVMIKQSVNIKPTIYSFWFKIYWSFFSHVLLTLMRADNVILLHVIWIYINTYICIHVYINSWLTFGNSDLFQNASVQFCSAGHN